METSEKVGPFKLKETAITERIGVYKKELGPSPEKSPKGYLKITSTEAEDPFVLAEIVHRHVYGIELVNGYQVNVIEFLTEKSLEFLVELLKYCTISEFQGTSKIAIDFLWFLWQSEYETRRTDLTGIPYSEILKQGKELWEYWMSRPIDDSVSEACLINNALYLGEFWEAPIIQGEDRHELPPVDMVRLGLYLGNNPDQEKLEHLYEEVSERKSQWSLAGKYLIGYERGLDREQIREFLGVHLPFVLVFLIEKYLWAWNLEDQMRSLGGKFPADVCTPMARFRYYFDHIGGHMELLDQ